MTFFDQCGPDRDEQVTVEEFPVCYTAALAVVLEGYLKAFD